MIFEFQSRLKCTMKDDGGYSTPNGSDRDPHARLQLCDVHFPMRRSSTAVITAAAWRAQFVAEIPRKEPHPAFRGLPVFHHHVEPHSIGLSAGFIFTQVTGELRLVGKPAKRFNPPAASNDRACFEQGGND